MTDEEQCPSDGFSTVSAALDIDAGRDPLLGAVFHGRYRIHEQIGRGGFGAVYRATQIGIGREVAVKVLLREAGSTLADIARFQQEARALAKLEHPNIVAIYDFGHSQDGTLFMVMELLRGRPLDVLLAEQGPLPLAEIVEIAIPMVDALAEAHAAGIVHRDLKPANVFLASTSRGRSTVKLLDFGIARMSGDGASQMTLTKTGQIVGSPPYMSPEQCAGGPITPQTDLYSLGCILYEALAGRPIFSHTSTTAWLIAHCTEAVSLPAAAPGPESDLTLLIASLLEKEPDARPHGIEQVASRLEAIRSQLESSEHGGPKSSRSGVVVPPHTSPRGFVPATGLAEIQRKKRSRFWPIAIVAILAVAGVLLAVGLSSKEASVDAVDSRPTASIAPSTLATLPPPASPSSNSEPVAEPDDEPPIPSSDSDLEVHPDSRSEESDAINSDAETAARTRTVRLESQPKGWVRIAGSREAEASNDVRTFETPHDLQWTVGDPLPLLRFESAGHRARDVNLTSKDIENGSLKVTLERLPPRPRTVAPTAPPPTDRPSW